MKLCIKCKVKKPEAEFYKDKSRKDGLTSWCAECKIAATKAYYQTERGKETHRVKQGLRRALNPERTLLDLAKQRAKKYEIEINIELEDIIIPDICPVLGIPIIVGNSKTQFNSPSIDRIDPTLGYIKGNINIISWRANRLKSDATSEEVYRILCYMMGGTIKRPKGKYATSREYNGKVQTLEMWAKEYNINISTLNNRVNRMGWTMQKALTTPIKKIKNKLNIK